MYQKRASQVLIYQKTCISRALIFQKCAKMCTSKFLDPIQKRASSRSVQLEAVQLKALLYFTILLTLMDEARHKPFSRQIGWLFVPMDKKFFCHF